MSFRSADTATSITTAVCWTGLGVLAFLLAWQVPPGQLSWWMRLVAGLLGGLVCLGYGIEALSQELTIRRWAISQLVFTTVGVVFLWAGIFDSQPLGFARVVCLVGAALFLLGALFSAAAAKELF